MITLRILILRFIIRLILVLAASRIAHSFLNNVTDREALLSFKASITDPLGVLDSWNNSIHFCQWKGVTCSRTHMRVTELSFDSQRLAGTLSPHIGNLSFLRAIHLPQNNFHGPIPNEIGRLFRLRFLELGHNSFQGGFPANLSHCVNLDHIGMLGNDLKGNLPTEFASWPKLVFFSLGKNNFSGSIPPSIGNISSLQFIDLRDNNLLGSIPMEIAHHRQLHDLELSDNSLWGMVPLPLYNISSLYSLALAENKLSGTLPPDLGFTLPQLRGFYIGHNRLSGPLPQSIANASNLVIFDVSVNNITGLVPMNLGSLPNLRVLNLGTNPLGDKHSLTDLRFFDSLVNCTYLKELDLYENGLSGNLPSSIVNLSSIEYLDLCENQLYGSIPRDIGKLVNMSRLALYNNFLTGTIPESIGELSKLVYLYLGINTISGAIPSSISNITQLLVLDLRNNMLQGSVPTGLFNISTLQELYLSNNSLGGIILDKVYGVSSQCVFLYLDHNQFTGQLPPNIGSFKQLVHLSVSNNNLTGEIPVNLGDCVMLEQLHMEGNHFQGRIPPSFKALKSLVVLDLSSNSISENIPSFFSEFHLLQFLNLSHNKLVGEVPKTGLFSNATAFSVIGNLQLCGGIQLLQLPACPVNIRNKKKAFPFRRMLLIVLLPLSIVLACIAFIFHRQQKSKLPVPIMQEQDNQYPRLSYQDLLIATNKFSPNNFLGEGRYGSVYKGTLEPLEQTVAVKVLNVEVHGALKSFLAECQTLRNIRHRNLIKIISTCSSTDFKGNDFKALVLEFMANGSLDNWLHPSLSYKENERNLTLLQRLNISIDVAQGVDYLHHHSHATIIHCDIKPSNILLDEEFVARVGDFGLARFSSAILSDKNQANTSSTGVRGTVGYVPPEYGMGGKISAMGDVYSYGILLLEMFSGERPTGSSKLMESGYNLHDYVKNALPHRVMDIADPRIVQYEEDHSFSENQSYSMDTMKCCLSLIFEVGILCSVETPRERIDISVAVKQLHVARDKLLQ